MIAIVLGCTAAFAQKIDKNEAKQLKAFLSQNAEQGGTNANALKVTDLNNFASIEGVTVANGHVTAIEWKDKHLAGNLDLSGFKALTKVDVSRNKIATVNFSGDAALSVVNASRNVLTDANFEGCSNLYEVSLYKNRLTDIEISDVPLIKTLNVSNNRFA